MRRKPKPEKLFRNCLNCLEDFRMLDLQSFHSSHKLHLACRNCIDSYLNSVENSVVLCPYRKLAVDIVLYA